MKKNYKMSRKNTITQKQKDEEIKFHYQAYIQEDRPNQPKEEGEIEY